MTNKNERLRLSEERLRLAMQTAKQAWFDLDIPSGKAEVSPEYPPFLGYTREEFDATVQGWLDHIHPNDLDAVKQGFQACLASNEPVELEYRRQSKSGDWVWIRSVGKVVERDQDDNPIRMTGIHMDISDRKKIERANEESRKLLTYFINHSPIYAFIKEVSKDESRVIIASDNFEQMVGIPADEMINKGMHDLFPEEMADKIVADDWKVVSTNEVLEMEEAFNGRTYSTIKFSIIMDGKALVAGYTIDVTDEKESERKILIERNQAQQYLDIAAVMVVALDRNGNISLINHKGCEILGYSEGEIIGKNWFDTCIPEEEREEIRVVFSQIMKGDLASIENYENEVITKHGERRIIDFHNTAIKDETSKINGILSSGEDITVKRETQMLLQESEKKYRTLFERMHNGFALHEMVCDEHGKPVDYIFKEINSAFEEMTGLKREQVIGRLVTQVIPDIEKDPANWIDIYGQVAMDGKETYLEQYAEPLGRWYAVSAFSPEKMKFATIIEDITERKNAEQKMAESEVRFRATFEQAAVGIAHVGIDGSWLRVNQRLCDMLGYSREELLGKTFQDITHPDDLDADNHYVEQLLNRQIESSYVEKRYFRKDGTLLWVNLTASLVFKEDGSPDYFISVVEDISDRREVEQELYASEHDLRWAQKTAHIGSWHYDLDRKMSWSDETYRVFGVSFKEFEPDIQSFYKLVHPDDRPAVQAWIESAVKDKKERVLVFRSIRPDGLIQHVSGQIQLVCDENGEPDHVSGTFQDITDRMLLEEQFHHAQKMEALGTLVGGIAHDFNNILAGMTGNVYLVKQRVKEVPDAVEKLETVEKLSFRAAELIRQLLTFARKDRVVMKPLPIVPFVKEAFKLLRSTLPENIEMKIDVGQDPGVVVGDATQLHQVIMNVVNNARDAVEDVEYPEINITLDLTHPDADFIAMFADADSRSYAHLVISDNGSGIAEQALEHIFEPFFTTKEVGKGTGLGLSMVFGAIQSHNGFIKTTSRVGKGTTIHIYLPVEESAAEMVHVVESSETVVGHGETILLVDDDHDILETGQEVLKALGYQVLIATDGEEAVNVFSAHQHEISLVIMDLVMPRMSGASAAEKMREMDRSTKIIFCTGYDKDSALPKGLQGEEIGTISKPYNIEDLSQAIHQELGH